MTSEAKDIVDRVEMPGSDKGFHPAADEVCVNTKEWIAWEEFKALPKTLQRLYIEAVCHDWSVGGSALAEAWGVSANLISIDIKNMGCVVKRVQTPETKARFLAEFVGRVKQPSSTKTATNQACTDEKPKTYVNPASKPAAKAAVEYKAVTVSFTVRGSAADVAEAVAEEAMRYGRTVKASVLLEVTA